MRIRSITALNLMLLYGTTASPALADEALPDYLHDRGDGVTTSLFGTYVRGGEWLVYPFYEYVRDHEEYTGEDLGISDDDEDYIGRLDIHQALLWVSYGITDDIAVELEPVVYEKHILHQAANDTSSGIAGHFDESQTFLSLEGRVIWRALRETATRPEVYTFLEVDHPLRKEGVLVGNPDWEGGLGIGFVKGFSWGTVTPRFSLNYDHETDRLDIGEWAVEYLKRIDDSWRIVATIEGDSDQEIAVIGEIQWHFGHSAYLKLNNGFGVHGSAPSIAPEIGIMFSF